MILYLNSFYYQFFQISLQEVVQIQIDISHLFLELQNNIPNPHPITSLLLQHLTLISKHPPPPPSWEESPSENRIFSFFTAGSFIEQIVFPVDNYFSIRWPQIVKIGLIHLTWQKLQPSFDATQLQI